MKCPILSRFTRRVELGVPRWLHSQVCQLVLADGSAFSFTFSFILGSLRRLFQKIKYGSHMMWYSVFSGILLDLRSYMHHFCHILLIKVSHGAIPDSGSGEEILLLNGKNKRKFRKHNNCCISPLCKIKYDQGNLIEAFGKGVSLAQDNL